MEQYADGLAPADLLIEARKRIWLAMDPGGRQGMREGARILDRHDRFILVFLCWVMVCDPGSFVIDEEKMRLGLERSVSRHPDQFPAKEFADCLRDIYGGWFYLVTVDPAWLRWNFDTVPAIARHIYEERAYHDLPILADALEDAGCMNADMLTHCRQPGEHVRGCWVVDLLLGKE
jgi:hypothetical protein